MQRTTLSGSHNAEHKQQVPARSNLHLLTVVLPTRDEEGCIASTVEDLRPELRMHYIVGRVRNSSPVDYAGSTLL